MSVGVRYRHAPLASMKCSSRRNCNRSPGTRPVACCPGLNEVQFPKELQRRWAAGGKPVGGPQ